MEKPTNFRFRTFLLFFVFVAVFSVTRVPRLWDDTLNPDAVNWHYRSQQFINGIKYFQFEKTYQHYHPGVTLMWVTGVPVELYKQVSGVKEYTTSNYQQFDFIAKLSVISAQFVLSLLLLFLLTRVYEKQKAWLIIFLLTLEPFFVGNSRLYHMDVLLSQLIIVGLISFYLAYTQKNSKYTVLSGIALGLAVLTKTIAFGAILYVSIFVVFMHFYYKKHLSQKIAFHLWAVPLVSIVTIFVFFPALWVNPVYYIKEIITESYRIGIKQGHEQIVFGEATDNANMLFYFVVLWLKSSPVLLGGLLFGLLKVVISLKNALKRPEYFALFLSIFYVGYFVVMSLSTKKLDRYMLVEFPFLALLSALGFMGVVKTKVSKFCFVGFFIAINIYTFFQVFPYYFTYTNPLVGSSKKANQIIAQKPFGIGIYELRDALVSKYGSEISMGFYDVKPMKSIYSNSKIFDVRVSGPSNYDIYVLGINESDPEKILDSQFKFRHSYSLYINGLEYWKVYEKEK